jgi:hypothetical protein
MPLGSNKLSLNKNKSFGTASADIPPVSVAIASELSNNYLVEQGYTAYYLVVPNQTVTYNITTNRPNATLNFSITGSVVAADFTAPLTGTITTDTNGNATLVRTVVSNVALTTNVNFKLQLTRPGTSELFAQSDTLNIYNIEFPSVTVTGTNVFSFNTVINNLIFDGTVYQIKDDATVTINSLGTLQDNVFQVLIGANPNPLAIVAGQVYRDRPLPVAVVAAGGGGSANDAGGGGAGGEVIYLQDSYVSQLTETTYNFTVGAGGQSGVSGGDTVAFAGEAFEISADGGGSPTGGSGGSVAGVSGGSQATNNPFNNTYAGGGGAGRLQFYNWQADDIRDINIVGPAGAVYRNGFTSNYSAVGGSGASVPTFNDRILRAEWPDYANVNGTQQLFFGMGGGGGAFTTTGGSESPGNGGDTGSLNGRGGTSAIAPRDGTATAGMGGGGTGTGAYTTTGGSGIAVMRVPYGPNFRFITSTTY